MKMLECTTATSDRIVVKRRSTTLTGVERITLNRHVIGMVLSGQKHIQLDGDILCIPKGHLFFMDHGIHFVEDVPSSSVPFVEIAFYYTTDQLQRAMRMIEDSLLCSDHSINRKNTSNVFEIDPSKMTKSFFESIGVIYDNCDFVDDSIYECLKLAELIYVIAKYESEDLLNFILLSLDNERANFDRIIYNNIFADKSIAELASESNRSCTSFKKDFTRRFETSPHRWYQQQRLTQASLLLNTTNYTIAQIGDMCVFPNPSHFIRIFKRHFGVTPAMYRLNGRN